MSSSSNLDPIFSVITSISSIFTLFLIFMASYSFSSFISKEGISKLLESYSKISILAFPSIKDSNKVVEEVTRELIYYFSSSETNPHYS